ncbi:MAG: rod shape-determining protein MreC [Candidatus Uhrbacteria bacterium]|nr:rod shape-determining protein MreC [Candidatus Uhrbacteria bacterium]
MQPRLSWPWIWAAALVAGVLTFAGLYRPFGSLVRATTIPVVRFLSGASAQTISVDERIKELESRLAVLSADQVRLRSLEEENRALRAQARFLDQSGYDSVGARVISRDVRGTRAVLTIDRGKDDSLEVGQAVVTDEGIMIGKVSALQDRIATVELLTDPRSRVAAAVQVKGQLAGVLEGRGNGASVLTFIPSSETVVPDQLVVTAGTEEKVPGSLPLGIVNTVDAKPSDPFFSATVEPLVALDRVVFVSVLRPSALRPRL